MSSMFSPSPTPVPRPPEPPANSVIGFTKSYSEDGPAYSFVAIHVDRLGWYVSGPKHERSPWTWDQLVDYVGGPAEWQRIALVTQWTPLVSSTPLFNQLQQRGTNYFVQADNAGRDDALGQPQSGWAPGDLDGPDIDRR